MTRTSRNTRPGRRRETDAESAPMLAATATAYQLKVTLLGIYPEIWRRLLVAGDIDLGRLHRILQCAMGWTDSHLHKFTVGEKRYTDPRFEKSEEEEEEDESSFQLRTLAPWVGDRLGYLYDFGDMWNHDILVESIHPMDPRQHYPVCLNGEGACPPEDCGGTDGYSSMVHAVRDSNHKEHKTMVRWVGGRFDPYHLDIKEINELLNKL